MQIKISEQGNIIEVTKFFKPVSKEAHIKKLSADEYIRLDDGEILNFQHSENRADLKQTLCRTFRKIRSYINTNFVGDDSERFITLTYAENMRDTERLVKDFEAFWKRFKRKYGKADYFSVIEPQERGAWHIHALVKFEGKAPYIPNDELRELWRQGFVNVRKLQNVDNIGAYLSAYLGDVEVPLDSPKLGVVKEFPDGTKKKFVKGGRLHLYPPGMNIYRMSRGIKKPVEYWATGEEREALVSGLIPTYANRTEIRTAEGFTQIIEKEFYNKKRKR